MPLDVATRRAVAAAALKVAETKPWRDVTVFDLADAMGGPVEDLAGMTVGDAIDAVEEYFDAAAARGLKSVDPTALIRDRLFDLAMRRFEAMETARGGYRSIEIGIERDPAAMALQHHRNVRTARWILTLAGMEADGVVGLARAQGLAVILHQAKVAWRQDDAGDFVKTMAALDKSLRQAEQTFGRMGGFEPPRTGPSFEEKTA